MEAVATLSRKEQIEQLATGLFQQKGYSATSMRDLAKALEIEAASIYSHIKSKEEILQKICFRMADEFFTGLATVNTTSPASSKLRAAIAAHVKVLTQNPAASAVFQHEWKHLSEPFLTDFLKMREKYENTFRSIIQQGISKGEFREIDAKFATLTLLSSLNWLHTWYKPNGKMSPEEIAENLAEFQLKGLLNSEQEAGNSFSN